MVARFGNDYRAYKSEVAHALFGQLRDELWGLPATWVVAARANEQAAYEVRVAGRSTR